MFKNYFKIAWRSLSKNKSFTILNIVGLTVAFAAAILLGMAAIFELSYDRFHKNLDTTHLVYTTIQTTKGAKASTSHPVPFAPALKAEVPGVDKITRFLEDGSLISYNEKVIDIDVVWVDSDFFSLFSFPVLSGNNVQPLNEDRSLVITKEAATRVFGKTDVSGETVLLLVGGEEVPFKISSVLDDIPANSSIEFEVAVNYMHHPTYTDNIDTWNSNNHQIFVQLQEDLSANEFENRTHDFSNSHYKESIDDAKRDGALPDASDQYHQISLVPLKDIAFVNYTNGKAQIDRSLPYVILGIALLLICIACINFINMSVAKNTRRLSEIGMRKTLGAGRKHVFFQFWSESVLIFLSTIVTGTLLSFLLLDKFKELFRTAASFENTFSPAIYIIALVGFLAITLIAGGYPAVLLSKIGTLQALKGKLKTKGGNQLRNVLMVVQFAIAILFISGTFVLWGQLEFMRTKDLGFNKEHVISFPINGKKNSYTAVELLRSELAGNPDILGVTASDNNLGVGKDGNASTSRLGFDHKNRSVSTNMLVVDYDYPEILDLEMVEGRSFKRGYAADSLSIVINEAMALELEEENPVNKHIIMGDSTKYTIIGILKNYHFSKLNKAIEPISLFMNDDWDLYYAYVKISPTNLSQSFDKVKEAWTKVEPEATFMGSFLDENIDRTFRREKAMITIITSGAIIAILLSCIGLLAISLLVVNQRTKEIGIRKVVGAGIRSLTFLLAKDFVKLVLIAFVVIVPIAWYAASTWLETYTYRMNLSVWLFAAAGLLAIFIALITISTGTIKAALQDPVKSLRTE